MSKDIIIAKNPIDGNPPYTSSFSTKFIPYINDKGTIIGEYVCNTNEFIILLI